MTASPESDGQQEPGRAGCVFPGRAGLAEGSPWRGKRGLCRHPPGRDHAAHVRLRGAARPRDWTTQRQEVVGWCQGAAGHANQYAEQVGKRHGLERGLEGSKSRHTTIKDYYGRVEKGSEQTPRVDVPDPSMGDRVNVRAYGEKVAASVVGQLRPKWQELTAKASELEAAKKAEREARATVDDQNKRLRPIVDALRPLNEGDRKVLASIVADVSKKIQADRAEKMRQRDLERRATRSNRDRGISR